jgi:hypothetical protein
MVIFSQGPAGGFGGDLVNVSIPGHLRITSFRVYSGAYVDRVVFFYGDGKTDFVALGGPGGTASAVIPIPGERYIRTVIGRHGSYVDSLEFFDDTGDSFGRFGGGGGIVSFTFEVPPTVRIVGLYGRASTYVIDAFGLNYAHVTS